MDKPAKNASRDAWAEYATSVGITVHDQSRDDLISDVEELESMMPAPEPDEAPEPASDAVSFEDLENDTTEAPTQDGGTVSIQFVAGGLTAFGKVWNEGEKISIEIGSEQYKLTFRDGLSWLDLASDPEGQKAKWGQVFFIATK